MKNYEKFLNSYIVQSEFTVLEDNKPIILKKDTVLEMYPDNNSSNESKEKYFYLPQGGSILISMNLVKEHMKSEFDIFQEKFTHLDKNHLYFGQVNQNEEFVIKNDSEIKTYVKIGEYITSEGKIYNAVEINDNHMYWEHDKKESYEKTNAVYFNENDLIEKNHQFSYEEYKKFFPTLSLEVSEEFINFPKMLEVIDSLFRNEPLSKEQEYVYKQYHEYIEDKELMGCGFYSPQNKSIEEIVEDIVSKKKNNRKYY